ncbi:hypothetical protein [Corynebacterium mayonis]|uniref:hypothetical protein n=1 Tax=Corynebacterium mayonis TaxID=3062461 RepID=UPI003140B8F0
MKFLSVVLVVGTALALGACQQQSEQGEEAPAGMGNAVPAVSPPATAPDGTVYPFDAVDDLDATEGLIAVRSGETLQIGSLEDLTNGAAARYLLDSRCTDVTANAGVFTVACADDIHTFTAAGKKDLAVPSPVSAAARTSTGEIVAGSAGQRRVTVFRDGEGEKSFDVARESDRILASQRPGQADSVVRINYFDTTIQGIDWENNRQGATLRAGLGVASVAAGRDGMFIAADATGSQLLVYNTDDIIRLQMTAPVAKSPWAVAWDDTNELAWITSTATNTAEGYSLSTGVPIKRETHATVADAQHMVVLENGTLLIASASGAGLQVIAP